MGKLNIIKQRKRKPRTSSLRTTHFLGIINRTSFIPAVKGRAFYEVWGKGFLAILFICLLFSSISSVYSGIVNSRHDLHYAISRDPIQMNPPVIIDYGEVCVYCHTPHSANSGTSAPPLWNRKLGSTEYVKFYTVNYTVYGSPTMDTTPSNPPSGISLACLSCHDGTIGVDEIINPPNSWTPINGITYYHYKMDVGTGAKCGACHAGGGSGHDARASYLGADLSNDHPISMTYPATSDFNQPPDTQKGWSGNDVKLYAGKVECSSCHSVHDPTYVPFLRKANSNSGLCTTCHIK